MATVIEVPVPGWERYSIRTDGQLRLIHGKLTSGYKNDRMGHLQVSLYNGAAHKRLVHRLVAESFVHNPRPDIFIEVDHIDRNPRNNHASNLRWLTRQLNALNNAGRGCTYIERLHKWRAYLRVSNELKVLGNFDTEEEAHQVAVAARKEAFARIYSGHVPNGPCETM